MRIFSLAAAVLVSMVFAAPAGASGWVHGNDTGGIIPWSRDVEPAAREMAAAHCAVFGKYARITGVNRRYGDYISFNCLWRPHLAYSVYPPAGLRHYYRHHR